MLKRLLFTAAIATGLSAPALAQDTYKVGLTGALTGPFSSTYAPVVDALRIYVDRVNAAGGVNGKTIELIVEDDQANPSNAAANAKKLIAQDEVILLIDASLSSTYAPIMAETKRNNVPLLFSSGVCPSSVFPPAEPLQFCTTAYGATYDSRAALDFIKAQVGTDIKIGFAAMAVPVSRNEIDGAEAQAKEMGMTPVDKEIVPPPTADYTPFATKLKDTGPDWVYSWAPWVTQVRTFEGLRKLGWEGSYISWAHIEAEDELKRLKDQSFYAIGANALFQDGLPIHEDIAAAAKEGGSKYPANQMAEGWIAGMVLEAALKGAGEPDRAKVAESMSNLKVDTKGLRGGPIEWTKDNHFRTTQYYRVYRWDGDKVVQAMDWKAYEVK